MKNNKRTGALLVALGVFFIYWAQTHSPRNIGQAIGNAFNGSYTMSETSYYISLSVGLVMMVYGLVRVIKK